MDTPPPGPDAPVRAEVYLAGLLLRGRRVVVVGGGAVAVRRVRRLLAAAADVVVVAPHLVGPLSELVDAGRVTWIARPYVAGDLAGAWYAVAATDRPEVNTAVAAEAEAGRVFCVRADRSREGTAVTPATGGADGLRVGVVSDGDADPRRAAAARDVLLAALESARLPIPPRTAPPP